MLSALALNGVVLHETDNRAVKAVTGLIGLSPVRRSVRVRPTAHGSIDDSRYRDEALITIAGDTFGTVEQAASEFRTLTQEFDSTLTTPGLLTWTEGLSGLALQRYVKLASAVEPTLQEAAAIVSYGVILAASDPVAYSQTLTTATGSALSVVGGGMVMPFVFPFTFDASAGGTVSFTNAGNADTRPLLRIYGSVTNPTVVFGLRRISLIGTVEAGEYVELDLQTRSMTRVAGAIRTSAVNMLDPVNTQWFSLPPGTSNLQLLAATFDASARLDVVGRSAYV